jgi:ubiquinone/menaquinone biosynthesis C-methylase UbiE
MTTSTEALSSSINKSAFSSSNVVDHYQCLGNLFKAEQIIFEKLRPEIEDARILDLGVGAGRTTKYLLEISRNYTGIDYVPEFVERARKVFLDTNILVGDARDLSDFEDESFKLVVFSFNGLDCITHEDRIKALKEIHRVLKKGGYFMFSSHNREYKYFRKLPWRRKIEFDSKFLKFFLYSLYHLPKHWAMKKYEIDTHEYALVNDSDHRYSLMFYYISPDMQIRQLEDAGFSNVEVYNKVGRLVSGCKSSPWLDYLARKV